jgi:hypothetical protein
VKRGNTLTTAAASLPYPTPYPCQVLAQSHTKRQARVNRRAPRGAAGFMGPPMGAAAHGCARGGGGGPWAAPCGAGRQGGYVERRCCLHPHALAHPCCVPNHSAPVPPAMGTPGSALLPRGRAGGSGPGAALAMVQLPPPPPPGGGALPPPAAAAPPRERDAIL